MRFLELATNTTMELSVVLQQSQESATDPNKATYKANYMVGAQILSEDGLTIYLAR